MARKERRHWAKGAVQAPPPGSSGAGSNMTRREAAVYIPARWVKSIAHDAGLSFVAYLLAMAMEEAQAEKSRED